MGLGSPEQLYLGRPWSKLRNENNIYKSQSQNHYRTKRKDNVTENVILEGLVSGLKEKFMTNVLVLCNISFLKCKSELPVDNRDNPLGL
jgi:hypothetical protein